MFLALHKKEIKLLNSNNICQKFKKAMREINASVVLYKYKEISNIQTFILQGSSNIIRYKF